MTIGSIWFGAGMTLAGAVWRTSGDGSRWPTDSAQGQRDVAVRASDDKIEPPTSPRAAGNTLLGALPNMAAVVRSPCDSEQTTLRDPQPRSLLLGLSCQWRDLHTVSEPRALAPSSQATSKPSDRIRGIPCNEINVSRSSGEAADVKWAISTDSRNAGTMPSADACRSK